MMNMQRLAEIVTVPRPGSATASHISARIPLQSAARTSLADSFSPGEAIGAVAPLSKVNNNLLHFAQKESRQSECFTGPGTPEGIRTSDLPLRRRLLYPAELLVRV